MMMIEMEIILTRINSNTRTNIRAKHVIRFLDMVSRLLKSVSFSVLNYRFLSSTKSFSYRQNLVSELRNNDLVGRTVSLHGWLHNRRMNSFGILRDHSGFIQFILPPSMKAERLVFKNTPVESCVHVRGILRRRPDKDINHEKDLGHLEVSCNLTKISKQFVLVESTIFN